MDDIKQLLQQWVEEARVSAKAHGRAARRLQRQHYLLGIPTIIMTAIVATAIFASLATSAAAWAKVVVGTLTISATVLSSIQTFLDLGPRSESHKQAETALLAYCKEIETLFLFPPDGSSAEKRLTELTARWHKIMTDSPELETHDWHSLRNTIPQKTSIPKSK